MLFRKPKRRQLNLALQGGGAHGAFTWGVLDRLIGEREIDIAWISATSAGSVNAVAVAHGLATGGGAEASKTLASIWRAVHKAGVPDLLRLNPFLSGMAGMSSLVSPYNFNPLGFDPLRNIIETRIDFEAIRRNQTVQLLIAATDVATGRARLFRNTDLSVDAVVASACLPTLHHAAIIDGRAYWDGGFSANPDLQTLASESPAGDTMIVQLNPLADPDVPLTANDIEDRVNTITFNQPLLRDVEAIVRARQIQAGWFSSPGTSLMRIKRHRFHLIDAAAHTIGLASDSKMVPDKSLLNGLHAAGMAEANTWVEANKGAIGARETVDLKQHFLEAPHNIPSKKKEPEELPLFAKSA